MLIATSGLNMDQIYREEMNCEGEVMNNQMTPRPNGGNGSQYTVGVGHGELIATVRLNSQLLEESRKDLYKSIDDFNALLLRIQHMEDTAHALESSTKSIAEALAQAERTRREKLELVDESRARKWSPWAKGTATLGFIVLLLSFLLDSLHALGVLHF